MSLQTIRLPLYRDHRGREYAGLWARVTIPVALAIVKVDGHWETHYIVTPQVRAIAERIVGGGYQDTVSAVELAEMVADQVITVDQYEAIVGEPYPGDDPGEDPEEPVDPGEELPDIADPDDPGGPAGPTGKYLVTEDGRAITTEDGKPIAIEE